MTTSLTQNLAYIYNKTLQKGKDAENNYLKLIVFYTIWACWADFWEAGISVVAQSVRKDVNVNQNCSLWFSHD